MEVSFDFHLQDGGGVNYWICASWKKKKLNFLFYFIKMMKKMKMGKNMKKVNKLSVGDTL